MKRTVKLWTSEGNKVRIVLDHWGSGLDHILRRWTLEDGGFWLCMDSGEIAHESGLAGLQVFSGRLPVLQLQAPVEDQPSAPEMAAAAMSGQTMVEYALIIATVGVVAWGAYNLVGHNIGSMASGIDSSLTSS